jgi:acetoin utilization protein AcuB
MKAIPTIQKFMTTTPHSINYEAPVDEAIKVMDKNGFRHLPVVKDGKPYGLISDRDIKLVMSFTATNPKQTKVGDVCSDEPYVTNPSAPINEVAVMMAEKKYGSALVLDNGKLVGIFTLTDACKALSEIVEQRFHS